MSEEKIIDGIEYSRNEGDNVWIPFDSHDALFVCECGNRSFTLRRSDSYETSACCIMCNEESVVHAG